MTDNEDTEYEDAKKEDYNNEDTKNEDCKDEEFKAFIDENGSYHLIFNTSIPPFCCKYGLLHVYISYLPDGLRSWPVPRVDDSTQYYACDPKWGLPECTDYPGG